MNNNGTEDRTWDNDDVIAEEGECSEESIRSTEQPRIERLDGATVGFATEIVDVDQIVYGKRLKGLGGVEDLIPSVREHGVVVPLLVIDHPYEDGKFVLQDGERRLRAAIEVGLEHVPIQVCCDLSPEQALELEIVTNVAREDLRGMQLAEAAVTLRHLGYSDDRIQATLCVSGRGLTDLVRVYEAGVPELKAAVDAVDLSERIPVREAARAAGLDVELQREAVRKMKGRGRAGAEVVRQIEAAKKVKRPGRKASGAKLESDVRRRIARHLKQAQRQLADDPSDLRAEAHLEVLQVLSGEVDVSTLYPPVELRKDKAALIEVMA